MHGRNILIEKLLNFIGGSTRWLFGTFYRKITNKKVYTFSEYLNGPKKKDYYDKVGHNLNNYLIGLIILMFILIPVIKIFIR